MQSKRTVLPRLPKSQHSPVIVEIGLQIPVIDSPPIPRWNLRKAHWDKYQSHVEQIVTRIPAIPENYERFTTLLLRAAQENIPRGARRNHIPGFTKQCESLLQEYNNTGNPQTADSLTKLLDEERRKRWHELVEQLDFTHSSRKSWGLLRKLGGAVHPSSKQSAVNPNKISSVKLDNSKIRVPTQQKKEKTYG